jgi:hypothetical protein
MKNSTLSIVFFLFIIACGTQPKDDTTDVDQGPAVAEYALDLDSAKLYIKRYDSISRLKLDGIPINAYTIRAADLLEALGLPENTKVKYTHARVYLGIDKNNKFRLFLTPVEGASIAKGEAGKDVILNGPHKRTLADASDVEASTGSYVLDFTAPCPKTCPSGSQLYPQK